MTDRDKKLLVFLGIFLVLVGIGWYIIRPVALKLTAKRDELSAAQQTQLEMQDKIALLPSTRTQRETVQTLLTEESAVFYPVMESQDIDKMLTDLALSYSLDARELTITDPTGYFKSAPYRFSTKYMQSSAEVEASGVYATHVKMRLGGSRAKLQSILDRLLTGYPSIRITTYTWNEATSRGVSYNYILAIDADIYMFELN